VEQNAVPLTVEALLTAGLITKKAESVDLTNLAAPVVTFMAAAGQAHVTLFQKPLIITSGRDSAHAAHSKHFDGKAIDASLHDIAPDGLIVWMAVCAYICPRVGCGIFYEFAGEAEEHFHVETNA
jgi:hypothetical protein